MNGKPTVFLLDSGSNVPFIDMHAARSIHFKADKVLGVGMTGLAREGLQVADLPETEESYLDGPPETCT